MRIIRLTEWRGRPLGGVEFAVGQQVWAGIAATSSAGNPAGQATERFAEIRHLAWAGYREEIVQKPGEVGVAAVGTWNISAETPGGQQLLDDDFWDDGAAGDGSSSLTFDLPIVFSGEYEVYVQYSSGDDRATNVPIDIGYADEQTVIDGGAPASSGGGATSGDLGNFQYSDYTDVYEADYYGYRYTNYYDNGYDYTEDRYYNDGSWDYVSETVFYNQTPSAGGGDAALTDSLSLDETTTGGGLWIPLGSYFFDADQPGLSYLTLTNASADGLVTIDAIRLLGTRFIDRDGDGLQDWIEQQVYDYGATVNTALDIDSLNDDDYDGLYIEDEQLHGSDPDDLRYRWGHRSR